MLQLLRAQRDVLSRWTPETSAPLFDLLRAAGNAGHWNNLPTSQQKGGKKEREPPLTTGVPNQDRFEAFLQSRKMEDDTSVRDLFSKRESGQGGWESYTFKNYDKDALPTKSAGQHADGRNWDSPQYETYYHGIKVEAMFAILAGSKTQAGGLEASSDRQKGQRYNADKKGVYFHTKKDMSSALGYAHWVPLFADGCYVQVLLQCEVDRAHRIVYDHKNQKLQKPNIDCKLAGSDGTEPYTGGPSIFLARLHVRIVGF